MPVLSNKNNSVIFDQWNHTPTPPHPPPRLLKMPQRFQVETLDQELILSAEKSAAEKSLLEEKGVVLLKAEAQLRTAEERSARLEKDASRYTSKYSLLFSGGAFFIYSY